MPREHYLDNSATTQVWPEVADLVREVLVERYGNPSSLHSKGLEAELLMKSAAADLAYILNCAPEELYFTSGGTEANNWAILSGYESRRRRATGVVTTAFEHSSVLEPVQYLAERQGAQAVFVAPDGEGHIRPADVLERVDGNTALVSLMAVNNEIGTVLPIQALTAAIKKKAPKALVHCDGVQAFGKLPINLKAWGVDLFTFTGHKIHAPKGVGALYIKKGVHLPPLVRGGKQQRGLRPGTENVAFATALALAAKRCAKDRARNMERVTALRDRLLAWAAADGGVQINSPQDALPYIVNLSVPGFRSETLLHFLAERGVYVSSGSACAKGGPSHVLASIGLSGPRGDSALRVSMDAGNTEEDIDALCAGLEAARQSLVGRR